MVGNSQRAAWNKAMGLPSNPNPNTVKKRLRREKKAPTLLESSDGPSTLHDIEYPNIIRFDRLERGGQVNIAADDEEGDDVGFYSSAKNEEEDEYDDLEELDNKGHVKKKKKAEGKRTTSKSKERNKAVVPKWMKPRTMASILIEESARKDSIVKLYLDAEARPTESHVVYPTRKFCPVTGLMGLYVDPKSRIPYATMTALEQIQERIPPWMSSSGGSATYYETVNSLRNNNNM